MSCFVTTSNNVAGMHSKQRESELVYKQEIALDYADYTVPTSFIIVMSKIVMMTTITLPSLSVITRAIDK
jgi:hypothetical protein